MEASEVVVLRQRPLSWLFVWLPLIGAALFTAVVVVSIVKGRTAGTERVILLTLQTLQAVGWTVFALTALRTRIELHPDELRVIWGFRTVPVSWTQITDVHGDVPRRLDWSTRLVVETGERTIPLPVLGNDLAEFRALLLARVPGISPAPPAAHAPPAARSCPPREHTGGQ